MRFCNLTGVDVRYYIDTCNFTEDEEEIFKRLARGKSIQEVADHFNCTVDCINKKVRKIKDKIEGVVAMKSCPIYEKVLLTPKEASEYSNIGLNKIYDIISSTRCDFVVKIGNKRLIKRVRFEEYLDKSDEL